MSDIRAVVSARSEVAPRVLVREGCAVFSYPPRVVWHYYLTVFKGGVVINEDDSRDGLKLARQAHDAVVRYRDMHAAGVRLRPWSELVEEAEV